MSINKRLKRIGFLFGMGLSTIAPIFTAFADEAPTRKKAMEILGTKNPSLVRSFSGGYMASEFDRALIDNLAGIYAGTVNVQRTENGYSADGFYSQYANPEALESVLINADKDKNRVITREELRKLQSELYSEKAR